jgi:hypothetical protein
MWPHSAAWMQVLHWTEVHSFENISSSFCRPPKQIENKPCPRLPRIVSFRQSKIHRARFLPFHLLFRS